MKKKKNGNPDSPHLVTRGIPQTREERGEFAADRSRSIFLKDNFGEIVRGRDLARGLKLAECPHNRTYWWGRLQATTTHLALVAHQSLRSGINLFMALESASQSQKYTICLSGGFRTGWKTINSAIPAVPSGFQVSITMHFTIASNYYKIDIPEPKRRAVADSFFTSFEAS